MKRQTEPELMDEAEQAKVYAEADFSEPHNQFIEQFKHRMPIEVNGFVLDLGCGPADISIRFAKAFPNCIIHGLDGAQAMLTLGREAIQKADLAHRVELYQGLIQDSDLPLQQYDVVISNSLLHHIHQPQVFWQAVKIYSHANTKVFIMDLMRPETEAVAEDLVQEYAKSEPEILQRDFYHSLKAAFTSDEIRAQLGEADLRHLQIDVISDRHLIVYN